MQFLLPALIKRVMLWTCNDISFVDSTYLCVCRKQRIRIIKMFDGFAKRGKCLWDGYSDSYYN